MEILEGLAMLLDQRGIALFRVDGRSSIFLDYMPERVEHSFALTIYGAEPETIIPGAVSWPRVQVRARGDQRSPKWSRDRLYLVYEVLHGYRGELPNGVSVLNCWGMQSAPTFLGPDAKGCFEHSLNFQLWVCAVPVQEVSGYART